MNDHTYGHKKYASGAWSFLNKVEVANEMITPHNTIKKTVTLQD
jgi:hypothetical protein